jgi:TPP-dependent pyruvate/acetoin dehydrogenase alpha subunit
MERDIAVKLDYVSSYRRLLQFRRFEETVGDGVRSGAIHGEMHLAIGHEAIAVGIEPLVRRGDAIISTHRPHLHALVAGVDPCVLLAELYERGGGLSGGKGGHMHLFDPEHDFMCTGIVGASAPLALGYAYERMLRGSDEIAICVIGDGAANHGTFAESLNMAALYNLPIIFIVEDNGYAISVARSSSSAGEIHRRGESHGIPGWRCDGRRVQEVRSVAQDAFDHVRDGRGPAVLVAECERFRGHYEGDIDHYRSSTEKDSFPERDPIMLAGKVMAEAGISKEEVENIERQVESEINAWLEEALQKPLPDTAQALNGVFVS